MIWHIALHADWLHAQHVGEYLMSTRGMTLDEVGYIHCSTPEQIEGVAERFYDDLDKLLLLEIDPDRVGSTIIEEPPAPGVEELFPHIYGPLPIAAVRSVRQWTRGETGWLLPDQGPENTPEVSAPFSE
jgi:glutathione S-transferase